MNVLVSRNSRHIWQRPLERLLYSRYDSLPGIRRREVSNTAVEDGSDNNRTRNIGIIAHIDAGKTTTTERMLYYSGCTRRIGDVDDGSTVTDFLPAERARGITIQSAAVTFNWPPSENAVLPKSRRVPRSQIRHTVNLIDTPGHADFTFEVLRSLRILDGAVCVLDGVAGVEAQTEKVWGQASTYKIPRIVFVNKLDRDGAAFGRTVKEIGSRLRGWPAVCQIPWWDGRKGSLMGVGDAIGLTALKWPVGGDGKSVQSFTLQELEGLDHGLAAELMKARTALVDTLCEFDEKLLNSWLELNDDSLAIPAQEIRESLRRCILDGSGRLIPVFAGASFRNIGVQPLLDAVNDLLPDPTERPDPEISAGPVKGTLSELLRGQLQIENPASRQVGKRSTAQKALATNIEACALAFKVVNDPRRGVLVYIRVYSGMIKRNASLWNTNLHVTERAQRLLQMQASEAVEISSIPAGQIGVIAGLKYARTGDTLISYPGANPKTGPPGSLNSLQLRPIIAPPPVFFAAVEPHSLGEEKSVEDILALLLREDPSLHFNVDEESRQMLLSGMGELHLEIARDRLVNDFKAKASMGSIEIGYRETVISGPFNQKAVFDREIAGKRGKAGCGVTISSLNGEIATNLVNAIERDGNAITVTIETSSPRDPEKTVPLPEELTLDIVHEALLNGASAALARGPHRGFPMHSTHVALTFSTLTDLFGPQTTPASIASAARLVVQATMREIQSVQRIGLLEPVMKVVISCDEASLGSVIHDISSARGGHVLSLRNPSDANDASEAGANEEAPIDISRIYAPPDPFALSGGDGGSDDYIGPGQQRHVTARVPLKEMLGYLKHLRSLTGGRGTFIMSVDRFERLTGPREKAV